MRRQLIIALSLLASVVIQLAPTAAGTATAASPPLCQPPASVSTFSGTLSPSSPLPLLTGSPILHLLLVGATGTFQGLVVFEPVPAPPPAISDGCKEDSRFRVSGFSGQLIAVNPSTTTPISLLGLTLAPGAEAPILSTLPGQPIDATLELHFGPGPSMPILTLLSDQPVLFLGKTVHFVQIVAGRVIQSA